MAGNKEGARKAVETTKKKYGDDFYAKNGRKGGEKTNPGKGFGSNRELAREMGRRRRKNEDKS